MDSRETFVRDRANSELGTLRLSLFSGGLTPFSREIYFGDFGQGLDLDQGKER